jgi:hypothetical protein
LALTGAVVLFGRQRLFRPLANPDEVEASCVFRALMRAWFTAGLFAATVALVLATGVLGFFSYVQSRDMKASIAVAKQSADAAKKAADAADLQAKTLFQAELPIVLVHNFRVAAREGEAINQLEIPEYPIFHFTIFNYGRTPAELVSYCVEQKVAKRLPETPEYEIERLITPGTVLGPHGGNIPFTHPLTVMGRERAVILNESEYLWLYGFVKFKDFMGTGETHETRFAAMGLLHSERPGQWFMFVYGSDTPAAYAERT